jgi:predicted RND superfamily exporter protein
MKRSLARILSIVLVAVLTVLAFAAVTMRLRLEPNVAGLLPERGEAAALRRYVRGFGGGDLAVVMIKGPNAQENASVAAEIAGELRKRAGVKRAADRIEARGVLDPMLAFRHAAPLARERLARALTPEGMRERLTETRALLLAPGSSSLGEMVAQDPLRLGQIVFESADIQSTIRTQPSGAFANDDGSMHLVLAQPVGQALRGGDARAFVTDAEAVLGPIGHAHPSIELGLTGGHAIAAATEEMLTRDLQLSGSVSMILASLVFALLFRRVRALVAVLPPLVLGTIWTAGIATLFPGGLSAIAVAFMSVVVGVGVDSGVHVYAALLEARRAGLDPRQAAAVARRKTARPVLWAAITAGAAFAALGLSEIGAVRQLGLLCAAGEVLTAVAIVLVTPEIGVWLEKGPPPPTRRSVLFDKIAWLTETRTRAAVIAVFALAPIGVVALHGGPTLAESFVAVRPSKLEPLRVQQEIFDAFGGKKGQWVVLIADRDLDSARRRADIVAEKLATMSDDVEAVDALTAIVPSTSTQLERFAARDALDLPRKADVLAQTLRDTGFATERFTSALEAMRHPAHDVVSTTQLEKSAIAILLTRYVGEDQGDHLVAIYVRPSDDPSAPAHIKAAVAAIDPAAMLTGYSRLEATLRESLAHDMPRIGAVAGLLVILALGISLRSLRDVAIASLVVSSEVAIVMLLIRVLGIPLHAYDALVLPVLLGITVDEGMFLLQHARGSSSPDIIHDTLQHEGRAIAATALTTSAGFAALAFCDFDGLRDLGRVGAIGSAMGLVVAVLVVPAGLRLARAAASKPRAHGHRSIPPT